MKTLVVQVLSVDGIVAWSAIQFASPNRAHIPICSPHAATVREICPTVEATLENRDVLRTLRAMARRYGLTAIGYTACSS